MAQAARPPAAHRRPPSRLELEANGLSNDAPERRTANDEATVKFIKRIFCATPATPTQDETTAPEVDGNLEDLLPRLTSRADIDLQLYAILAVVLSQFVQSWYNRITPDADFISEVVQIVAHCTRELEQRLKLVNLDLLLLDELPGLLDAHLQAADVAMRSSHVPYGNSIAAVYQTLRPHNALLPLPVDEASILSQRKNEVDWSQLLVDSILPLLLPSEDLVNPCLDVMVAEIFSGMIIRNAVMGRACQPWLLWEGCTKAIYALKPKPPSKAESVSSSLSKLEQSGLLSSSESVQYNNGRQRSHVVQTMVSASWATLRYIVLSWTLLRVFLLALMQASSLPMRSQGPKQPKGSSDMLAEAVTGLESVPRPMIGMRLWRCIGRLTSLETRMPWLTGCLSLAQHLSISTGVCGTNSAIDRMMSAHIHERLLCPAHLPPILQAIRSAVFPGNVLGPARQPPSHAETIEIKRECARAIVDVVPHTARTLYFATQDTALMQADVESTLDLFADAYLNKNLMVAALELLVVRLFPETAETAE
ncbi:hypothetical protein LTR29_010465 [Friedmanniomyces endolithicus]|nr:hypothetical protein LTR29_010465 [Friedmanniomyces endolithicus]